jgi:o-succinylbenzoate synthase
MIHSFEVKAEYVRHTLDFRFDAGTSRGVLKSKDSFFIRVVSDSFPGSVGYGEAGPLPKLSIDDRSDFEEKLRETCEKVSRLLVPKSEKEILDFLKKIVPEGFPSIRFALEVALLDLIHGGKRKIMSNNFFEEKASITINGLIWMGDKDFMLEQIQQKLGEGYGCIKIKIGSIDFDQECALLRFIRERFTSKEITVRVDANGAFSKEEALGKLQRLAEFDLHSIEQPIRQGQWVDMKELCKLSPVPIALDEELIGVFSMQDKIRLLQTIQPQFVILKPTLVGGIGATREWISLAEQMNIGWWVTSALESNIGLNAIAQLTASYEPELPQGLGTGQLYHNNIHSPLTIDKGRIFYDHSNGWGDIEALFGREADEGRRKPHV